jgi:streptogramin lyase
MSVKVGSGDFQYELDEGWPKKIPTYWNLDQCADVATDSQDRVWVFSRGLHPVTVWSPDGQFEGSWGNLGNQPGEFRVPHGIFIDKQDNIWLADHQTHTITKHALDGTVLMTLGTFGYANITVTTTNGQGTPFNMPTAAAVAPDGKIWASDGYANRRFHRFAADGTLEGSWGEAGTGPRQFSILHKVGVDPSGRVYICDRENGRIQIFDNDGNYITEWKDLSGPGDIVFADGVAYVVEQGSGSGISIWTLEGELITRFRGLDPEKIMGAAHGMWVDSKGNIYVAEIGQPGRGQRVRKFNKL